MKKSKKMQINKITLNEMLECNGSGVELQTLD